MTCSLYLPKNRRSFDDKLQRSIAECCTQAERWLRIFNEERTFNLSLKMAPLSLGKKKSKTGRRPWAPGRKTDRPPARPGMYFKTTPTHPPGPSRKTKRTPTHPLGVCLKKAGWVPARPCRRSWRMLHLDLSNSDLSEFSDFGNSVSGTLDKLCGCGNLSTIQLAGNNLTGSIPECIQRPWPIPLCWT